MGNSLKDDGIDEERENGIRVDLVDRIKEEIANSSYKVRSDKIADKIARVTKDDESSRRLSLLISSSNRLK